jgi:WD40 repeat protein
LFGEKIAFSPDGQTVAVIGRSGIGAAAWLHDTESGQTSQPLTVAGGVQHSEADDITEVAFSPDGSLLATASEWSRHVALWDVAGNLLATDRIAGTSGSMRIAFRPGARTLAVAADRAVTLFQITGQEVHTALAIHPLPIRAATLGLGAQSLFSLATSGNVDLGLFVTWWPGALDPLAPHESFVNSRRIGHRPTTVIDPLGRGVVYSTTGPGTPKVNGIEFWAARPGRPCEFKALNNVKQVRFGPDGRLWVAAGDQVLAFALPGWLKSTELTNDPEAHGAGWHFYTVAPGQAWVLAGRRDGRVFLLDPEAHKLAHWTVGSMPVSALELDESVGLAVAGDESGHVKVFRVPSGEAAADRPHAHRDAVEAAAFAPGGGVFATGSRDRTIRLWRSDGTPILTLRTTGPVTMLAFSADGAELTSLTSGERGVRR